MALDIGTLVAKVKVDDSDFDRKTSGWSTKGAAIGSAFGNLAADGIAQASQMLVTMVGDAAAASDATAKFAQTLEFAGLDTSKIDMLRESTQAYADDTVYNLGDIQQVTATLAANGVTGFETLAMSLGNLNAVAGGNAETFGRVGSVLTQTAGQGKLTTENWNQLTDAIPGASKKLQDALLNAGAYTGNFREAMEKGEISADEFNAAIQEVGTDPVAVEAAKSVSTFEGAQGNLAAAIQSQLVVALDALKPAFTGIQNGLAWFIQNSGLLVPAIAGLAAVLLAVLGPAIWAAVTATWAWTAALLANPMTWIILAIGLLVAAIVWLIMNWDTAVAWISEVWSGFMTWMGEVISGFAAWFGEVWNGIVQFFTDVINNVVAWVGENWGLLLSLLIGPIGLAIQWLVENWGAVMEWFRGIIDGIVTWWNGVWNSISDFFKTVWNGIVTWAVTTIAQFINGWKNTWNTLTAFFSGLWNGIKTGVTTVWDTVITFFQGIPGKVKATFDGAITWLTQIGRDIINGLWNGLKEIAGNITGWFEDTFGGIIDTVAGLFQINSPSRLFRSFGLYIGQGLIEGLDEMQDPIDEEFRRMTEVPAIEIPDPDGTWDPEDPTAAGGGVHNHVHMSMPAGTTTEEAIFAALGSPRVKD